MISEAYDEVVLRREVIAAQNRRRYEWRGWLDATDRALRELEELNAAGSVTMPAFLRARMRHELSGLPASCREPFVDSAVVQDVLDSVFEVQELLFLWRDPNYETERDVEQFDTPQYREAILALLRRHGALSATEMRERIDWRLQSIVCRLAPLLAREGVLTATTAAQAIVYAVAGEDEAGG